MPFEATQEISGYPPGGTPSVGHKEKMKVVLAEELAVFETFYCGGGTRDRLLELRTEDVVRFNKAVVAKISRAD